MSSDDAVPIRVVITIKMVFDVFGNVPLDLVFLDGSLGCLDDLVDHLLVHVGHFDVVFFDFRHG